MTREEAYHILTKYIQNKNLINHCRSCEAAMQALCKHLHPDASEQEVQKWGITGLLHDFDYEIAQKENKLEQHGNLLFAQETGIPGDIKHAIQAHNFENTKILPENDMDWAIACVDQLTGLIIASALIKPEKRLDAIDTEFVLKRFGKKDFARGVNREAIQRCETELYISLKDFIAITLKAMQQIHAELGL